MKRKTTLPALVFKDRFKLLENKKSFSHIEIDRETNIKRTTKMNFYNIFSTIKEKTKIRNSQPDTNFDPVITNTSPEIRNRRKLKESLLLQTPESYKFKDDNNPINLNNRSYNEDVNIFESDSESLSIGYEKTDKLYQYSVPTKTNQKF